MTTRSHQPAIWLIAASVMIQGFGMAVYRAAWSGHYHAAALSAVAANDPADAEGAAAADHHSHATVEHHHHDADDSSVVNAQSDSAADRCGVVPKRQVADLGLVASVSAAPAADGRDADWDEVVTCAFASHVTAPLDRPPRLRG